MGHTCGEPNEIELTAAYGLFYRSFPGYRAVFLNGDPVYQIGVLDQVKTRHRTRPNLVELQKMDLIGFPP